MPVLALGVIGAVDAQVALIGAAVFASCVLVWGLKMARGAL